MKKMLLGIAAMAFLGSCQQVAGWFGKNKTNDSTQQTMHSESANMAHVVTRDESITTENAYSDLFVDSAALENFIAKEKLPGDNAERMRDFYAFRNNQFAWFSSAGITEQGRGLWSLYAGEEKREKNEPAATIEQRMDSLVANDSSSFSAADTSLVQTELALTAQLVQLASENKGVVTADNFYWLVPRKKMDALALADSLLNKQKDSSLWQNNAQYTALKKQLQVYYTAAQDSGWKTIPSQAARLRKGIKSPVAALLKKRLAATGDYATADTSNLFNDSLAKAIRVVQEQFGLRPTGQLSDSLVRELNVPAQVRVQQILVNMNRTLWMAPQKDSNEISVNIPSLELVVHGDTGKLMILPVIVGKEGTGTIAFRDKITQVVFSPYWNIPQSIVQREIWPAMQKDPAYLQKHHMEVVKQTDSLPQIRQLPGNDNALGHVKFLFPNSLDIYLHDTPHLEQFAQQNRALSHGCIRVAHPDSLAHYILRNQPAWTPEKISQAMNSGKEQKVDVTSPVPVAITYFTAWADERGRLNFRRDVYGYDQKTAAKMFTAASLPAVLPSPD